MSAHLENIIKNILSPINEIRKSAEQELNNFYENMNISDLDNLFNQIIIVKDENIKLYISILIKKFIEEKISKIMKNYL